VRDALAADIIFVLLFLLKKLLVLGALDVLGRQAPLLELGLVLFGTKCVVLVGVGRMTFILSAHLRRAEEMQRLHLHNDFGQCVALVEDRDHFAELLPVLGFLRPEHVGVG
jgi:hypothetical protein